MSWFGLGKEIAEPVNAIGSAVDKIFTSDDERAQNKYKQDELEQKPIIEQAKINQEEAKKNSLFHSGWRPAIGWTCAYGLFYHHFAAPMLTQIFGWPMPPVNIESIISLLVPMLGIGGYRTYEKVKGVARR